ncbi:MAG: hypothetical protein JOZ63_01110, partial [Planctomycetaceae bacterium]|nr:hypothetical protein [Planctomycetaceae bacterium]
MRKRVGLGTRLGFILLAIGALLPSSVEAQPFPGPLMNATGGGLLPPPPPPPPGAWGEVIFSNAKWLVIQNHDGQQFPIDYQKLPPMSFLVRWPSSLFSLTNQSLVEAIGVDQGSNLVMTDHIDVFEGADQVLVKPTYQSVLPGSRPGPLTVIDPAYFYSNYLAWDFAAQNSLYGWAYPVPPVAGNPAKLHVVGNPIALNPLRLGLPGNNFATVVPANGILAVTQVTLGSPSMVQTGDIAFLIPASVTPQS